MDYEHLRAQVLSNAITDHHDLLNFVNSQWAHLLGFSLKIKRSPKINKDGKSIRLYCSLYNMNFNDDDCQDICKETGLEE